MSRSLIDCIDRAFIDQLKNLHAVHAGAVLFGNRAVLLPGKSFAGKSSLVAELLRRGATCLSDEYALIDGAGIVHAYPRPLLLRNGGHAQTPVLPGTSMPNSLFTSEGRMDSRFALSSWRGLERPKSSAESGPLVPATKHTSRFGRLPCMVVVSSVPFPERNALKDAAARLETLQREFWR